MWGALSQLLRETTFFVLKRPSTPVAALTCVLSGTERNVKWSPMSEAGGSKRLIQRFRKQSVPGLALETAAPRKLGHYARSLRALLVWVFSLHLLNETGYVCKKPFFPVQRPDPAPCRRHLWLPCSTQRLRQSKRPKVGVSSNPKEKKNKNKKNEHNKKWRIP